MIRPMRFITIAAPALLACWASTARAEPTGPTMLVYGNYCGLGSNAPLAPIDALDAACARHDACTPDDDLPVKACHVRLEREAQALATDPRQPDHVRVMASFVAAFAATAASKPMAAATTSVRVQPVTPHATTWTILR